MKSLNHSRIFFFNIKYNPLLIKYEYICKISIHINSNDMKILLHLFLKFLSCVHFLGMLPKRFLADDIEILSKCCLSNEMILSEDDFTPIFETPVQN